MKSLPSSQIKKRLRGLAALILLSLISISAPFSKHAFAQCSSPAGVAGQVIFGTDENVPAYCDGTDWIGVAGGNPSLDVPTTDGLLVHWKLDETSGTIATDSSGNAYDGTVSGTNFATDSVVGVNGNAINFDGTGDEITLADTASLRPGTNSWSTALWFKASDTDQEGPLIHKREPSSPFNQWQLFMGTAESDGSPIPSKKVSLIIIDTSFSIDWYGHTTNDVIDGRWHHVVATRDGSNQPQIYIDGVLAPITVVRNTGARPDNINNSENWAIGGNEGFGSTNAQIDDVRIYNRTLTAEEIAELYTDTKVTKVVPTGLVAHWRLDETSGTTAFDSSLSGYHGTMLSGLNASSDSIIGKVDQALNINGRVIDVPSGAAGTFNELTYTAWINISSSGLWDSFISSENIARTSVATINMLNASNELGYHWSDCGSTCYGWSSGLTVPYGEWAFIAMSVESSGATLYVGDSDGNLNSSTHSLALNSFDHDDNWRLGGYDNIAGREMNGALDDARIYNRALTPEEIAEIYAAKTGIRYNENHRSLEFFDSNQFVSMTPQWPEPAPTKTIYNCSNPGDVCSDGTVFAGYSPDGNVPMFTTRCNQGQTWNGSTCTGSASNLTFTDGGTNYLQTTATSDDDGDGNTAILLVEDSNSGIAGIQPHDAAVSCDSLTDSGHSDWYLPAENELDVLFANQNAIGNFESDQYWSSSDSPGSAFTAYRATFPSGSSGDATKNGNFTVRCVRQGSFSTGGVGSLIGHWKLDETSGTIAYDSSGNGFNANMINGMTADGNSIPGAVGKALMLNIGDNPLIGASHTGEFDITDQITLAAWVQVGPSTNWKRILGKNSGIDDYLLQINPGSTQLCLTWIGGTNNCQNFTFENDRWHHVAATFVDNTDTITLYADGVSLGSLTTTESFTPSGNDIGIGSIFPPGSMDDARIYNRALSATEIAQLYNMGAPVGSNTALPLGCPNIGEVCDDGTYYIGLSPDGSVPMFAAKEDAPADLPWNDDIFGSETSTGATDDNTGLANNNLIVTVDSNSSQAGFQEHAAPQYCYDLNHAGANDWYLPSRNELGNIYNSGQPIANVSTGSQYWSSTEQATNVVRARDMSTGNEPIRGKNVNLKVRCVRKGPAPRCANPYGIEGQMIYNSCYSVVQYCDGARWIMIGKSEAINDCL